MEEFCCLPPRAQALVTSSADTFEKSSGFAGRRVRIQKSTCRMILRRFLAPIRTSSCPPGSTIADWRSHYNLGLGVSPPPGATSALGSGLRGPLTGSGDGVCAVMLRASISGCILDMTDSAVAPPVFATASAGRSSFQELNSLLNPADHRTDSAAQRGSSYT